MADGGAPVVDTDRTYAEVLLGELWPSPTQPRKGLVAIRDDDDKLVSFVAHILDTIEADTEGEAISGIRDALRVRRRPEGGFEIVDGECRYHAARLGRLRRVTCEIVVLSDEQVIEEQLVANGARKDLTPLEEAEAFAALRARGLSVETIHERVGRSVRTIHKRLALVDRLTPDARQLLAAGSITVVLAEQLAALSVEAQARAVDDLRRNLREGEGEPLATRDARWSIDRARLRLKEGGFPLDDATLVPAAGACTGCPKRSGTQIALFLDGLGDADLCGDEACFKSKREAQLVRLKDRAKEQGLRVVDKPAEVKKLFPYSSNLAYDAPFVDLGERCDLVRPPSAATKNEGRKGGPKTCTGDGDGGDAPKDGKHDFDRGSEYTAEEYEDGTTVGDEGEPGCKEAFAAGCAAWVICGHGCGGWEEIGARPGAAPKGWKPPTWGEVLREAIAKVAPAGESPAPTKPDLVAEDGAGGVHELVDKRQAVRLLQEAQIIDKRQADQETRNVKPPKKPGELDKFEIDRRARDAAEDEAFKVIVAKAEKKAPDVKFWRLLAALCIANNIGDPEEAAKRREVKASGRGGARDALREYVAAEKDEGKVRGLVVELLIGDAFGTEEAAGNVACRFYGIDLAALQKEAAERVKAEAKEKAKTAAAKAKKGADKAAKKTTKEKASPKPAPTRPTLATPPEPRRPSRFGGSVGEPSQEWIDAFKGTAPAAGTCQACGCTDNAACKGECAWADLKQTVCSNCAQLAEHVLQFLGELAARDATGATGDDLAEDLDVIFGEEDWYTTKHRDGAIRVLEQRGRIVLREGRYVLPVEEGEGFSTSGNVVCTCRKKPKKGGRHENDCAIAQADKGRQAAKAEPSSPSAPTEADDDKAEPETETVQLDGTARKAVEARPCPKCGAKAHKVCVGPKGKLGTAWFHAARAAIPPLTDDQRKLLPLLVPDADLDEIDKRLGWSKKYTNAVVDSIPAEYKDDDLTPAGLAALAAGPLPPKAPPAEHADRKCAGCGCSDAGACTDGDGECTWERLGDADICSVCLRCAERALLICRGAQAPSALIKALTTKQKKGDREIWDKARAEGVVAHLEQTKALTRDSGKLLAAKPAS